MAKRVPSLLLRSPYPDCTSMFDQKGRGTGNVYVKLPGLRRTLCLHRHVLERASAAIRDNLSMAAPRSWVTDCEMAYGSGPAVDENDPDAYWREDSLFCGMDRVASQAAVQWLRFAYGGAVTLDVGRVVAMAGTLSTLRLTCHDDAVRAIKEYVDAVVQQDAAAGVALLRHCAEFKVHWEPGMSLVCDAVVARVLTTKNMEEHYDTLVCGCLVDLPAQFLLYAQYGPPKSRTGEYNIRKLYLTQNESKLTTEERHRAIPNSFQAQITTLSRSEMCDLHKFVDLQDRKQQMCMSSTKNDSLVQSILRAVFVNVLRVIMFISCAFRAIKLPTAGCDMLVSAWTAVMGYLGCETAQAASSKTKLLTAECLGDNPRKQVTKEDLKVVAPFIGMNLSVTKKLDIPCKS